MGGRRFCPRPAKLEEDFVPRPTSLAAARAPLEVVRVPGRNPAGPGSANHQLVGLAAVTIAFEAVAGGGMEDVEAVGNLRAGTAILTWNGREWTTAGQAVFNLDPREVLQRYRESLMPLGK